MKVRIVQRILVLFLTIAPSIERNATAAPIAELLDAGDLLSYFVSELSPYGRWGVQPQYGRVWEPNDQNQRNWRPYSRGHWQFSQEYGWVWKPDEQWLSERRQIPEHEHEQHAMDQHQNAQHYRERQEEPRREESYVTHQPERHHVEPRADPNVKQKKQSHKAENYSKSHGERVKEDSDKAAWPRQKSLCSGQPWEAQGGERS